MSRTDDTGAPYRRRAADRRSSSSRVATIGGALVLVLLVLYYMVAATMEVRELRGDLEEANRATLAARAAAAEERQDTLERLTSLQTDLDNARAEVASLREQLITAGITPVAVGTSPELESELDGDRDAQEAAGAPETAPEPQSPPQAAPAAPGPAPVVPGPTVAPAPSPPAATVGGDHLLCILTICL